MDGLTVVLLQLDLKWQDSEKNLARISEKIEGLGQADLVVLPEMFTTGFSMEPGLLCEKMDGKTIAWMKDLAQKTGALLIGSLIIEEKGSFYNRLACAFPNGGLQTYDKRHLFRMAKEGQYYRCGNKKLTINHKGWNICPLICYDLRFPVWSRNNNTQYDLLVYIANWPEKRREHWTKLLYARAIENQAYVVGVNRVGLDGNGIGYSGDSMVVDPKGGLIHMAEPKNEKTITVQLSKTVLEEYREAFPVYLDADRFKLI